jgi:GntR family transcriptional regulator, transcriptional repressor for pyruvate dehydrogenase complex
VRGSQAAESGASMSYPINSNIHLPKAAELVANELRRRLLTGEVSEGANFPTESLLSEELAVSKPTIREAMRVLESEGLVRVRRGLGGGAQALRPTSATVARHAGTLLQYNGATLEDIIDCRAMLEVPAIGRLASRGHDPDTIAALEAAIDRGTMTGGRQDAVAAEGHFHETAIGLAGNKTLSLLCSTVNQVVAVAASRVRPTPGDDAEAQSYMKAAHRAHVRVVQLIKAGDRAPAEAHWDRHLRAGLRYLLSSPSQGSGLDLFDRGR